MHITHKRTYNAQLRQQKALRTKEQILQAAKLLFEKEGVAKVTVEKIARKAHVSAPTIYSVFKSKRGILLALMDNAFAEEKRNTLVKEIMNTNSASKILELAAGLSRQLYDSEKTQLALLRGAFILDRTLKELEAEREHRRYERQKETVERIAKNKAFKESLTLIEVKDILWAFTGRDLYRLLVIERGWTSGRYEAWLANLLKETLLR